MMNEIEKFFAYKFPVIVCFIVALGMWGCPQYNVWTKTLSGKAQLKKAEWDRQIKELDGKASLAKANWDRQIKLKEASIAAESASFYAHAEVEKAKGVAQANQIIGQSLRDNEAYLRYLWVTGLQDGKNETIYIPTEANMPILEATRRKGENQ